ncbi:MAG TPA: DUF1634 domain-containing protein [Terriglobales bacterium]|jgi:uncharacterized membrane protein|nr:DUF1634 domain-containing protein [Terriglobales bacterium]
MNDYLNPALLRDKLQEWLDRRIEIVLAQLLRAGVLSAALVVIAGAVLYLGAHPRAHVDYRTFHAEPEQLRGVHGVLDAALQGQAMGIMQLGLLLLIATPIARVVFSVFAFALEGDRMYVVFTLIVLSVLLYSLFGSFLIA